MGKIVANKSLNCGYRYVWDEDTKFIIYQNNKGNIILGTINHEGQIQEKEIKKIYEFKIKYFGIFELGSGECINYENIVYVKNLLKMASHYEVERILKELSLLSSSILYYEETLKKKENKVKFVDTIFTKYDDCKKYPQYWKLEHDDCQKTSLTIENTILKILLWFYDIGITRNKSDVCDFNEKEDYRNWQLFETIHQKFRDNNFNILEEPKLTVNDVYNKAKKENQTYDRITKYLNKYIQQLDVDSIYRDDIFASKKAIQYYTIVGKPYLFAQKLEEERNRKLKLTKKESKN